MTLAKLSADEKFQMECKAREKPKGYGSSKTAKQYAREYNPEKIYQVLHPD